MGSRRSSGGISVEFTVRVIPRSSRSGIAGVRGDALLAYLRAAPVEGAANAELVELISKTLRVAKSHVSIVSGVRGKTKRVSVSGVDRLDVERTLGLSLA